MHRLLYLFSALALASEVPSAESLLDRFIEVSGGPAAYESLKSQKVVAEIEFVGQGIKGTTTQLSIHPLRSHTTMELAGLGKMFSGVWDGVVWESSAMQGQRLANGAERSLMLRLNDIQAAANWRKYYSKVETEAEEEVLGERCYRIVSTPQDGGKPEYTWLAKDSGLLRKYRFTLVSPMGEIPMEIEASDYRKVGNLLLPHQTLQSVGPQKISSKIREISLAPDLSPNELEPPAEIKTLIAKQKP